MGNTDTLLQSLPSNSSILLPTYSSPSLVIKNSQPNTHITNIFCKNSEALKSNIIEKPSTGNYYEQSDDGTPIPSPYTDFGLSPNCDDDFYLDNPVSTPEINVNDTDSPIITPNFRKRFSGIKKAKEGRLKD